MRFWCVGLLLALALAVGGCQQPPGPGRASREHLLEALEAELEKPPAQQDQQRLYALVVALRQEISEQERIRQRQQKVIDALLRRRAKESPSGEPPLSAGPLVVEVQFSFDTRVRDLDDDTPDQLYVTVWPKDQSGDMVKVVGTMQFVLSRQPPFLAARGEVLQRWFQGPRSVDKAWQDAWVLRGHHFKLKLNEEAREARRVVLEVGYIAPDGRELTAKKLLKL